MCVSVYVYWLLTLATASAILSADHSRHDSQYYPDEIVGGLDHYSYSPAHHYYRHDPHHHEPYHHDVAHHHNGALQALLIPLAGVALLGAAAVFASNPILLQLGVISGRRKRRQTPPQDLLSLLAKMPVAQQDLQKRRLLADYLHSSPCVERLACELNSPAAKSSKTEHNVMDRVISEIVSNEFIDEKKKKAILKAWKIGYIGENCKVFSCPVLDFSGAEIQE